MPPDNERSAFANEAEVKPEDRVLLESATGRQAPTREGAFTIEEEEIRNRASGTRPVGDRTTTPPAGGGDIETDDGLDEMAEAVRHAAEDIPDEPEPDPDDIPVFDRGAD